MIKNNIMRGEILLRSSESIIETSRDNSGACWINTYSVTASLQLLQYLIKSLAVINDSKDNLKLSCIFLSFCINFSAKKEFITLFLDLVFCFVFLLRTYHCLVS